MRGIVCSAGFGPRLRVGLLSLLLAPALGAGTVGWFFALDEDQTAFEREVGPPLRVLRLAGGTVASEYSVGPHRVVAAKMGSGCVTTAVTVARVLALRPVDRVVSTGPAGWLGPDSRVGEWFRIEETVAWQQGRAAEDGRLLPAAGAERRVPFVAAEWPDGAWLEMPVARLASGEVFVASAAARGELANSRSVGLVEMNAFGLLAALDGTPVRALLLRVASDRADESAGEDFAAFLAAYDGEGGRLVAALLRALPVGEDEPLAHPGLRELLE